MRISFANFIFLVKFPKYFRLKCISDFQRNSFKDKQNFEFGVLKKSWDSLWLAWNINIWLKESYLSCFFFQIRKCRIAKPYILYWNCKEGEISKYWSPYTCMRKNSIRELMLGHVIENANNYKFREYCRLNNFPGIYSKNIVFS